MNDLSSSQPSGASSAHLEFECQQCGTRLKVSSQLAGRKAKCPKCSHIATVPSTETVTGEARRAPENQDNVVPPTPVTATPLAESNPSPSPSTRFDSSTEIVAFPEFESPATGGSASGTETETRKLYRRITEEVSKVFVGQDELVLGSLVALFSGGHVLIESVPGLGKTLFVRTLGKILGCQFGRIQFTADLMPSDITGAPIFNMKTQEFDFRPGPVFTQLLLADEINRSPAKTHAALLEIMQEKHVTIDGTTHELTLPFLVVATQNPIESEGTYNLPEAQLDRFMFKLIANYPSAEQEAKILLMHGGQADLNARLKNEIQQITSPDDIVHVTQESSRVRIDPLLVDYINKLVRLTRDWPQFYMGASTRAGIALMQGARTLAAFYGRDYAVPDDVVQIALPALRHRVMLTAEAEVEGQTVDQLLSELIRTIEVPRLKANEITP
jgi:MoxR-like ATPase